MDAHTVYAQNTDTLKVVEQISNLAVRNKQKKQQLLCVTCCSAGTHYTSLHQSEQKHTHTLELNAARLIEANM